MSMSHHPNYESLEFSVPADFSQFDSIDDVILDLVQWGRLDELRERLCGCGADEHQQARQVARDIAFELAGAKNRALAVDVFLHATGIAEFSSCSLRDYAAAHGCSHEWFRQQVLGMCQRLQLELPGSFQKDLNDAA